MATLDALDNFLGSVPTNVARSSDDAVQNVQNTVGGIIDVFRALGAEALVVGASTLIAGVVFGPLMAALVFGVAMTAAAFRTLQDRGDL